MPPTYLHKATLIRIVDADTIVLDVDLGFQVSQQVRVRLAGIDACDCGPWKASSPWGSPH